ncbi:MAG: hypothetical protein ACFFCI_11945 [Promethearchaeota archaeon]
MKYKFTITYLTLVVSTALYVLTSYIAADSKEMFYSLLTFGLMIIMFIFLCVLVFFFDARK